MAPVVTSGEQTGNAHAGVVKVLELEETGTSVPSSSSPPENLLGDSMPAKKPRSNAIAAQDPKTDFGAFEPDVAAMVALERGLHRRKASSQEEVVRQRLALLWRKHGDDAFARGLEVCLSKGKGLDYGVIVMQNYDSEPAPLRSIDGGRRFESAQDRAAREFIEGLPRGCDLPDDPDFKPCPQPWDLNRPAGLVALLAAQA
jgi:hypothetical protein